MSKDTFMRKLDSLLPLEHLPPLKGHSVRIRGATQLLMQGVHPAVIKNLGQWTSEAFMLDWLHAAVILGQQTRRWEAVEVPVYRQF
jgi:hypothetical protein